jgi:hypothetical protein
MLKVPLAGALAEPFDGLEPSHLFLIEWRA